MVYMALSPSSFRITSSLSSEEGPICLNGKDFEKQMFGHLHLDRDEVIHSVCKDCFPPCFSENDICPICRGKYSTDLSGVPNEVLEKVDKFSISYIREMMDSRDFGSVKKLFDVKSNMMKGNLSIILNSLPNQDLSFYSEDDVVHFREAIREFSYAHVEEIAELDFLGGLRLFHDIKDPELMSRLLNHVNFNRLSLSKSHEFIRILMGYRESNSEMFLIICEIIARKLSSRSGCGDFSELLFYLCLIVKNEHLPQTFFQPEFFISSIFPSPESQESFMNFLVHYYVLNINEKALVDILEKLVRRRRKELCFNVLKRIGSKEFTVKFFKKEIQEYENFNLFEEYFNFLNRDDLNLVERRAFFDFSKDVI